ncbi:hypothetical protein [Roseovarius sp. M141]|uniref:hypothetical protein n=1 Tax=Roseovarius sp. M141 TaxID=2583806 RepID=UPI0020CD6F5D|nr:hypothetical protein [Roseovarius sp. M141]MCQ0090836.1 hypothetical protein [Roseovarius sp. M141]
MPKIQISGLLSADNPAAERHILVARLRDAAARLGLNAPGKVDTLHDGLPMTGISSQSCDAAQTCSGAIRTPAGILAITQVCQKIRTVDAHFRSITTGSRRAQRPAAARRYAL